MALRRSSRRTLAPWPETPPMPTGRCVSSRRSWQSLCPSTSRTTTPAAWGLASSARGEALSD
eukprot:2290487-Alexandrium_andersonii.AAC.1